MLAPETRTPLLEALRPPAGMELRRGVATTFTLDLGAALTAPLAFAAQRLGPGTDPIAILQAISSVTDRLDIFCQVGMIAVPREANALVAYLERMVHTVKPPHPVGLFHPKVWVLEFGDAEGSAAYRLVCGSRNLTHDRSWDVVLTLDGALGTRVIGDNAGLAAFVRGLPALAIQPVEPQRIAEIDALAEGVRRVVWQMPEDVESIVFHPMGMNGRRSVIDMKGDRHLVISPFINDVGIERIASVSRHLQVISRVEGLEGLTPKTIAQIKQSYVLEDFPVEADPEAPVVERPTLVGLHAKTYIIESGWYARVFLGSANATDAAFDRNVEMLVELGGKKKSLGIDATIGDDAPLRRMLDAYSPQGGAVPDDKADRELENALRRAASVPLTARIVSSHEGFRETVTSTGPVGQDGFVVTLSLLTRPGTSHDVTTMPISFESLEITDVSPFLVLQISNAHGSRSTVVHASLVGDPPGRLDEVLARQVDTPEKFLRFLALLLALGDPTGGAALLAATTGAGGEFHATSVGLFERLVRAFGQNPSSLDKLSDLVQRLRSTEEGSAVMPDGFLRLWDSLAVARRELSR